VKELFFRMLIPVGAGTALAAALALLRPLTRRRFSPGWHYYTWLAPLAAMLIPLQIRLPGQALSLERGIRTVFSPAAAVGEPAAGAPPAALSLSRWDPGEAAAGIWLGIAAALLLGNLVRYGLWRRRLVKGSRPVDCPRLGRFTRRRVAVRRGGTSSPMLVGLIRPVLFLPDVPLTDAQLDHVLAHETVHLRRGDLWIKWFAMLMRCLYWFDPAVWLIGRQMERDCELSCDRAVVADMEPEQIRGYLDTLLTLAAGRPVSPAAAMGSGGRFLKKRFRQALKERRTGRITGWLSLAAAAVLLAGTLTVSGVLAAESPAAGFTLPTVLPVPEIPHDPAADLSPVQQRTSFLWPCPDSLRISALFGDRWGRRHTGVDLAAPVGSPAVAIADGRVLETGADETWGVYLLTDHGVDEEGREVTAFYAHLDGLNVSRGDPVRAGQTLGVTGLTGNVTGPCLHFEIRQDGHPVDPMQFYISAEG